MGRYLEDFRVGEVIKHWPGRTIRDFDDTWFTLLTMNTNPLHLDEHFASQSQHGRCLVNGTLVFALAVGMSVRDISENALANLVRANFDLTPRGIIEELNLRRPVYQATAAYGHFGRDEDGFTWENVNKAESLRNAAGV